MQSFIIIFSAGISGVRREVAACPVVVPIRFINAAESPFRLHPLAHFPRTVSGDVHWRDNGCRASAAAATSTRATTGPNAPCCWKGLQEVIAAGRLGCSRFLSVLQVDLKLWRTRRIRVVLAGWPHKPVAHQPCIVRRPRPRCSAGLEARSSDCSCLYPDRSCCYLTMQLVASPRSESQSE
jgi:hypothetical protein